jgi:hypothetical protein
LLRIRQASKMARVMYKKFRDEEDGVIKVMLRPGG